MKKLPFQDKVVVVTGASSGIGRALACAFARQGARVVAGARSLDKLEELKAEILQTGRGDVRIALCDVTRQQDCRELIEMAVEQFGGVDVLINNAGLSMRALFDRVDLEVLRRLMEVNFWGAVYCTKYALPYVRRRRGSIVGISSVAGFHGLPGRTGYSASKYALHGFLETVRIENLKKGVHVMIVAPGFTASNVRFSALTADGSAQGASPREEGRMMSPQEVAERVVRGVRGRRREVLMDFDGRMTVWLKKFAPGWLDRLFYNHMAKEPDSPLKAEHP